MTTYIDPEDLAAATSDADALRRSLRFDDEAVALDNFELCCLINAVAVAASERPMTENRAIESSVMRKLLAATARLNALAWERLDTPHREA